MKTRSLNTIIDDILHTNGISNTERDDFLNPSYDQIADTYKQFPQMAKAVARVKNAIDEEERILVWGDFDVDGLTATAIMVRTLRHLGAKPEWYVPDRKVEGHGLNRKGIKKYCSNIDLLITVDTGIQNYQEIKYAQYLGCDVILTDHHLPRDYIPSADAILHLDDSVDTRFSGAGIAFKFAQALLSYKTPAFAQSLLWLAMLGTVVDCVPQLDENRVISKLGLEQINAETPACIRALALESGMKRPINKNQISWKLAPMLNSASRLSMAKVAQDILLAEEHETQKILGLANELSNINVERKEILEEFYQKGLAKAQEQLNSKPFATAIAVVFDIDKDGDPRGVQGILAARLADEHLGIPTFCFTDIGSGVLVGSARTPKHKFPMLLDSVEHLIIGGGGHSTVGGMSLYVENLDEFLEMIDDNFHSAKYPANELDKGIQLSLSEVNYELWVALSALEPYGNGDSPLFEISCQLTGQHAIIGQKRNHIKFEISDGTNTCSVLAWNKADDMGDTFRNPEFRNNDYIIRGRLKMNDWTGEPVIEIEASEIARIEVDSDGVVSEVSL